MTLVFGTLNSGSWLAIACPAPNPIQMIIIAGLMLGSGIFVATALASAIAILLTALPLIVVGANLSEIAAAIAPFVATGTAGDAAATLLAIVVQVLGCSPL